MHRIPHSMICHYRRCLAIPEMPVDNWQQNEIHAACMLCRLEVRQVPYPRIERANSIAESD